MLDASINPTEQYNVETVEFLHVALNIANKLKSLNITQFYPIDANVDFTIEAILKIVQPSIFNLLAIITNSFDDNEDPEYEVESSTSGSSSDTSGSATDSNSSSSSSSSSNNSSNANAHNNDTSDDGNNEILQYSYNTRENNLLLFITSSN